MQALKKHKNVKKKIVKLLEKKKSFDLEYIILCRNYELLQTLMQNKVLL